MTTNQVIAQQTVRRVDAVQRPNQTSTAPGSIPLLSQLGYSNLTSKLLATNPQAAIDELAIFYTPQMFGAGSSSSVDDTAALQACYNAAIADGKHVFLPRQYRTGGLVLDNTRRGVLTLGRGGLTVKREFANQTGLMPVDTGQDFVLKLGNETDGFDNEQSHWINFTIDGDNKETRKGLVWFCQASQLQFDNYSFHRNRGPAMFCQKLEDGIFNAGRMVYLGKADPVSGYPRGAIVFSDPLGALDDIGSNAVWFNGLRMEWIDGGFINTDHNAAAPHVNSVFFNALKAEAYEGDADAGSGVVTYGTSAPDWPIVDFAKGNIDNRIGIEFNQPFFSHAENALCVVRVGHCERFVVRSPTLSGSDEKITLFRIETETGGAARCKAFSFTDPKIRNYGVSNVARNYDWSINNEYPVEFDLPQDGRAPSVKYLSERDPWNHAAEASWFFSSNGYTLVPEPDAVNNPCQSWKGVVGKMSGSNSGPILIRLNYQGVELNRRVGLLPNEDHVREFRIIACKDGHASDLNISLYDGAGEIPGTNIAITSGTFREYVVYYSTLGLTGDIRLKLKSGNNSAHIFYWSKFIDRGVQAARRPAAPTAGQWDTGDMVFNSAPAAGQPAYWLCSAGGNPGTWLAGPLLT